MFRCTIDLINYVAQEDILMHTHYPENIYECDSSPEGSRFALSKTAPLLDWWNYQMITTVMDELLDASAELTDGKMYSGRFEVWVPGDRPSQKVLDGNWQAPPDDRVQSKANGDQIRKGT